MPAGTIHRIDSPIYPTYTALLCQREARMTSSRRKFMSVLAAVILAFQAAFALAAPRPWDEKAFQAAQAAGKPILIDIYANW